VNLEYSDDDVPNPAALRYALEAHVRLLDGPTERSLLRGWSA
jgi:hypothetical protein